MLPDTHSHPPVSSSEHAAEHLAEYNALMDAARARAVVLRREAINAFCSQLCALPAQGARSATRLASRLARHTAGRTKASRSELRLEA